ncbi:hypothetical protein PV326_003945 [Microctonus aethiopoides]|nr:hypothetical protein PV326_003945 [Microctonus aethiopoides]
MKLTCNLEIVNRQLLAGRNITSRGKSQHCVLSIGKQSVKDNELYLLLQTRNNSSGTKYKVKNNIENVFTKFVSDGKSTIRLKEPAIDLTIKCNNPIELKSFLHILKLGLEDKLHTSILSVSNLNPKKINPPPKKKVTIKSKADYPVLKGFPRTTEELYLCGLDRKSFDRQILRLQSLRVLDLSNNSLSSLPKEIGTLPHLKSLHLGQNEFGAVQNSNAWSWLNHINIQNNLQLLDLSENHLKYLPKQIGKLSKLVTLLLNKNELKILPASIGRLSSLTYLNVGHNLLTSIPGSIMNLRLESLNVFCNFQNNPDEFSLSFNGIPTLKEFGARSVVNNRFNYNAATIPFTLVQYLDDAKLCPCGNSCFDVYIHKIVRRNPQPFAKQIVSSMVEYYVPFSCTFCCTKCANEWYKC